MQNVYRKFVDGVCIGVLLTSFVGWVLLSRKSIRPATHIPADKSQLAMREKWFDTSVHER